MVDELVRRVGVSADSRERLAVGGSVVWLLVAVLRGVRGTLG